MLKSYIFSLPSMWLRSLPLRTLSVSPKSLSDEIYNKNFQLQLDYLAKKEKEATNFKETIDEKTKRWKEKHEIYYGGQRDLENFPMVTQQPYHPKVRLCIFPDEWFHALYNKTGVTGPYLFFWGGLAFVLQKEYLIFDHDLYSVPATIMGLAFLHKKLGKSGRNYFNKLVERKEWAVAVRPKEMFLKMANKRIESAEESKATSDVVLDLWQGAKENVGLQLESEYRNRVATVHRTVKRRLDYQVEKEVSKLRYQKQHMIDWIVSSVIKDFSVQQEKATLTQCISDLRALAQKPTESLA